MEDAVFQRVNDVIRITNTPLKRISDSCGLKQNTFSQQINGKSAMSAITLVSILRYFSDVSAEWLLRGTGGMYLPASVHPSDVASSSDCSSRLAAMAARLEEKDRQIEMLKELLMRR